MQSVELERSLPFPRRWALRIRVSEALAPVAVLVALQLAVFGLRTAGIHFDENNYLSQAYRDPRGENWLGKPPLFYALNFILNHTVGFLFGPWRYLAPFFVYVAFNAWALVWLSGRLSLDRVRRYAFLALVGVSPFFLFNATQVMMELPTLGLLCVLFGCLVPGEGKKPIPRWFVPTAIPMLLMIKDSTLPAMIALIAGLGLRKPAEGRRCLRWLLFAFPMHWLVKLATGGKSQNYGGLSFLLDPHRWPARLAMTGEYLGVWLFYLGPLLAIYLLWNAWLARDRSGWERSLLAIAVLSLLGTFAVQMGLAVDFARYAYQVIWVGLVAGCALAAERARPATLVGLGLTFLVPTLNQWLPSAQRFGLWPRFVSSEGPLSDGQLFSGEPIFGWTFLAEARFRSLCVQVSARDRGRVERIQQFFRWAFDDQAQFFGADDAAGFAACSGAKVIARQEYGETPAGCRCPSGERFLVASCRPHPGTPEQSKGVWDLTCLP